MKIACFSHLWKPAGWLGRSAASARVKERLQLLPQTALTQYVFNLLQFLFQGVKTFRLCHVFEKQLNINF